ncbi:hypothetical protein EV360DRAFT_85995 [Lentinula raphanica]|nr:hypothetical protein EV360DRAFT_85995 [Lentinula raphanica]
MTRSASHTLAILVLGAAISSSVLAAPTSLQPLPAMSDSPIPTGAQPLYTRSVGQTSEVTPFQRRQEGTRVNLKSPLQADGDLTIDDPKHDLEGKDGRDSPDNTRSAVPVHLDRREELPVTIERLREVIRQWEVRSDDDVKTELHDSRTKVQKWNTEYDNLIAKKKREGASGKIVRHAEKVFARELLSEANVYSSCETLIGALSQFSRPTLVEWRSEGRNTAKELSDLLSMLTQYNIPDYETIGDVLRIKLYKGELAKDLVPVQDNQKKGGCCTIL